MPVQQQNASFAKHLGARVAQANMEHKDKPVDTGNRRLPPDIRDGVAKLSTMYCKEQTEDGGKTPKGQTFLRASAIVLGHLVNGSLHTHFKGENIAGAVTSVMIPLCDVPAKGQRKAKSFSENWFEFQNLFKMLGVAPCPETPQTDPTGQRTEAYFFAAMQMLCARAKSKDPVHISFSTRGFTPDPKKPDEVMVFEDWHGLANFKQVDNPAAGVQDDGPPTAGPAAPPSANGAATQFDDGASPQSPYHNTGNGAAAPQPAPTQAATTDLADVVAALVEVAMNDPEGATPEGVDAAKRLEQYAWQAGWTQEQTAEAKDWAAIGDMALNPPQAVPAAPAPAQPAAPSAPTAGSKWLFCKRDSAGNKLMNDSTKQPFPPQEVEVTAVDAAAGTCTVKTTRDGKEVVNIRSKKPIPVKFEWLEPLK